jgi:hypothetical protein
LSERNPGLVVHIADLTQEGCHESKEKKKEEQKERPPGELGQQRKINRAVTNSKATD